MLEFQWLRNTDRSIEEFVKFIDAQTPEILDKKQVKVKIIGHDKVVVTPILVLRLSREIEKRSQYWRVKSTERKMITTYTPFYRTLTDKSSWILHAVLRAIGIEDL